MEQVTESCTPTPVDSQSQPQPSQDYPQQVGGRVEQLTQLCNQQEENPSSLLPLSAFPQITESPKPKKKTRVDRWVKVSKQKPRNFPLNLDPKNIYHPARTQTNFCQPKPSSIKPPQSKPLTDHEHKDERKSACQSLPLKGSSTSGWPFSRQFLKVFV